ncbi:MAG: XdhC family protein [Flavobacteriales bacterium]|nr:XdhC family protein [Flavobacteriales bacterium]
MSIWKEIRAKIESGKSVVLLYVVESIGSSPGRQGFKMFVSKDFMYGSIGGGFMEHKLVELAKSKLQGGKFIPFVKRQVHQSNIPKDRSGMICSGEQTVAFVYLDQAELEIIELLVRGVGTLCISEEGLSVSDKQEEGQCSFDVSKWEYREPLTLQNSIYIIGGGHVGLALSKTTYDLDFRVTVLDNRDGLNTMAENQFASEKKVIGYPDIASVIPEGDNIYLVLMSFGYKTDKECIQNLLGKRLKYFGVMGSQEKMRQLIIELKQGGCSESELGFIHTPIGVSIDSKTPAEIAVSIAAEIIGVKNKV